MFCGTDWPLVTYEIGLPLSARAEIALPILLVSSSELGQRATQHRAVIEAAVRSGVKLIGDAALIGDRRAWYREIKHAGDIDPTERASDLLLVDEKDIEDRKRNLQGKKYSDYMDKEAFLSAVRSDMLPSGITAMKVRS